MNFSMLRFLFALSLMITACSPAPPAEHEDLAEFVEVFSECARIYRVYSDSPEMLSDELAQVDFPENWEEMADSLIARYGGDVDFWIATFNEISSRSRR
jgi:hypothetical protein